MMRYYGLKKVLNLVLFKCSNLKKEKFECPVCGYCGPFMDIVTTDGPRKHAKCPNCTASERHRLQFVVLNEVLRDRPTSQWNMLHFAPEPFFREFFTRRFGQYETADLKRKGVDHKVDLQQLPFGDKTYDFVFASHVLEHIPDDHKAIFEIHRILKPNGMAILPVPIYSEKTIEYPEPNPHEFFHVRAPGTDYFDRYERYFQRWRGLVLVHCRRNTSYLFMKTMAICRKGITLGLLRCKGTSLAIGSPCVTYEL